MPENKENDFIYSAFWETPQGEYVSTLQRGMELIFDLVSARNRNNDPKLRALIQAVHDAIEDLDTWINQS